MKIRPLSEKTLFKSQSPNSINENTIGIGVYARTNESIKEKEQKGEVFSKKIDIEIILENDYIKVIITDNGIGFSSVNLANITKPYFTTKSKGTGLGLPIVNKILNDHNADIKFINQKNGAKIEIFFQKNVN